LGGRNPITAAVFSERFLENNRAEVLPEVRFRLVRDLLADFEPESFDYIIGTAILCHDQYEQNFQALHRLLKLGGQILFFEANHWNPQYFSRTQFRLSAAGLGRHVVRRRCGSSN
jgi:SAM-dependent methyltransferase